MSFALCQIVRLLSLRAWFCDMTAVYSFNACKHFELELRRLIFLIVWNAIRIKRPYDLTERWIRHGTQSRNFLDEARKPQGRALANVYIWFLLLLLILLSYIFGVRQIFLFEIWLCVLECNPSLFVRLCKNIVFFKFYQFSWTCIETRPYLSSVSVIWRKYHSKMMGKGGVCAVSYRF